MLLVTSVTAEATVQVDVVACCLLCSLAKAGLFEGDVQGHGPRGRF